MWTKVETDQLVIVNQVDHSVLIVQDARNRIRRITLRSDALIPVVIGVG